MRRGWRWSLAGVVGLVVAVSLFIVPALGDEVMGDVGELRLQLNSDGDRFVFDPVGTNTVQVQELRQTNCRLSNSPPPTLMSVTGTGANLSKNPYAGLKDHRLGVGQKGEGTGEPCARINQDLGQQLTLSLTGVLDGAVIDYAEIDLGFKFNGNAELVLERNGLEVGRIPVDCNNLSDCGPDSGGRDNLRVILDPETDPQISGPFDTIILSSTTSGGVVSLEGGLGGTGDTLFNIVKVFDGEIDCEDPAEKPGANYEVTRGLDTDGFCKGPVDGLLYNFEAGSETVGGEVRLFVDFVTEPVDTNTATVAQFLEVITWTFADPPNVVGGAAQQRTLYYDDHVTGVPERVMPWCLKDPRPIGPGTTGVLPSGHTSCLIEANSQVTMAGDFETTHTIYNIGDGKRGF